MGSTSQFSSDSYKALMNSPTNSMSLVTATLQRDEVRGVNNKTQESTP